MNRQYPRLLAAADKGSDHSRKQAVETALENGFTTIILAETDTHLEHLGRFTALYRTKNAIVSNGKKIGTWYHITSAAALDAIEDIGELAIIETENWHILPLETLIARLKNTRIYAVARTKEETTLALQILETGCAGVVIKTPLFPVEHYFAPATNPIELTPATITKITQIPLSDRVCIDTTSILQPDEGMLIGSSAACLFFICSENAHSQYATARPFRVNAGAIHSYIQLPDDKTAYVSELRAGSLLPVITPHGAQRTVATGRIKIEKRPMLLIEAEVKTTDTTIRGSVIVQNAETIRIMTKDGARSVADIAIGDSVLVKTDSAGRHFGTKIDETIREL